MWRNDLAKGRTFGQLVTNVLFVCAVAIPTLPFEAESKGLFVGGLLVANVVVVAFIIGVVREIKPSHLLMSPAISIAVLCGLYMAILGPLYPVDGLFEWRNWAVDLRIFLGIPIGYVFGLRRSGTNTKFRPFIVSFFVIAVTLAANLIMLRSQYGSAQRISNPAMFMAVEYLLAASPIVALEARHESNPRGRIILLTLLTLGLVECLAATFISATRSLAIMCGFGVIAAVTIACRSNKTRLLGVLTFLACFLVTFNYTGAEEKIMESHLSQRFIRTEITSETRYSEVSYLIQELSTDIWCGRGFGSEFLSPALQANYLVPVAAPHVGILTFLLKGGVGVFLLLVVTPMLLGIHRLWCGFKSTGALAAWVGVVGYYLLASMSGGWEFTQVLMLGVYASGVSSWGKKGMYRATRSNARFLGSRPASAVERSTCRTIVVSDGA